MVAELLIPHVPQFLPLPLSQNHEQSPALLIPIQNGQNFQCFDQSL